MAQKSNNIALGIAKQPTVDTFPSMSSADYMPISQLRISLEGVTIANDEYTGSTAKNGDTISGKRASMSFNVKLRPPGGTLPLADAYLPGRLLQAAKMTELRTTATIPSGGAEAVSSGSTTGATLGSGATGTADLYKGLAIQLDSSGTTLKSELSAIRSYTAGKVMTLVETLSGSLSGNYLIPTQLSYLRSISSSDPTLLAFQTWIGGDRWDWVNCRPSSLRLVIPVSTQDRAAYPELQVTIDGEIYATTEEAAPAVTPLGAIPTFKDGDMWLANKAIGGSEFSIDLGLQTERPPNPNKASGSEAAEIIASMARLSVSKQKYSKSVQDIMALADAQASHPFFAQWGSTSGNIVQVVVPDARFNYAPPDASGGIVTETVDLMIDAYDRGVCVNFPYGSVLA